MATLTGNRPGRRQWKEKRETKVIVEKSAYGRGKDRRYKGIEREKERGKRKRREVRVIERV
jgi:hypothetical protein